MASKDAFYFHIGGRPRPRVARHAVGGALAFLDGVRVLFASDFHVRARHSARAIRELADAIRAENADLILFGGDYAEGIGALSKFVREAGVFSAPLGVFGVRGNNDYVRGGSARLRKFLASSGIRLLLNEEARIALPGGGLVIGGIDDFLKGHPDESKVFSSQNGNDYRILLSHFPFVPESSAPGLLLSGHTHGGQVRAFGIDPYSTGLERIHLSRRVSSARLMRIGTPPAVFGERDEGQTHILVSRGVGMSRLEIRVGCPAEIHLITFRTGR